MKNVSSAVLAVLLLLTGCGKLTRPTGLKITYGPSGLERLTFNGAVLEDLTQYPADAFHIWHIKAVSTTHAKLPAGRGFEWGENNQGRTWDSVAHTWHYQFPWGSIATQFTQSGDTLAIRVTESNNADSGAILAGATIYPLVLHFSDLPKGFGDPSYEHLAVRSQDTAPVAVFEQGQVAIRAEAGTKPLYYGFEPAGKPNAYTPVISSTSMDSMAASYPRLDRPVHPGETDTFTVSLQFSSVESSDH